MCFPRIFYKSPVAPVNINVTFDEVENSNMHATFLREDCVSALILEWVQRLLPILKPQLKHALLNPVTCWTYHPGQILSL